MPTRPDGSPFDPNKTSLAVRTASVRLERRRYYQSPKPARYKFTDWASI